MKSSIAIPVLTLLILSGSWLNSVGQQHQAPKYDGKKYVLLDELMSKYKVQRYTLNTLDLYGTDETIELYNIDSRYGLVLMSVLPHFYSDSNWKPIDPESIQNHLLDIEKFTRVIRDMAITKDTEKKKTMDILLVKLENGTYSASNVCLTEFFYIVNYPSDFNVPMGLLNIGQAPLTMKFMKDSIYPKASWLDFFPVYPGSGNSYFIERAYLSRSFEKNRELYYQFWTLADWNVIDGYNMHRGIDRFVYSPEKGIVAGSFDFYFVENYYSFDRVPHKRKRNNKSIEELQHSILEEKVMWAAELKDEMK